jgi:hypothetical protein
MADEVRQEVERDGRAVSTGKRHKVSVSTGVCSDHASKAPWDCCRKTVRKAAQEDCEKDG